MSQENVEAFKRAVDAGNRGDVEAVRDLGDRLIAIGRARMRGEASGAVTESPIAYLVDFSNAKATRVQSYLDPQEAPEAAGLRK